MSDHKHELRNIDSVSKEISIAIVASEFNEQLVGELLNVNEVHLEEQGFRSVGVFRVPGALEIPSMVSRLVETGSYDLIICLGVVVRGETTHYDTVAGESARAIMDISIETDTVIINGILTCENEKQAQARISEQYAISGLNYVAELVETGMVDKDADGA